MFDELQNINLFPTTVTEVFVNIFVALFCGLFIAWLYRRTYKGPGYSVGFINSIILLAMITSVVIKGLMNQ